MALPPTNPPGLVRDAEDLNKVVNGEGTTNRAGDSLPSIKAVFERINDEFDAMQAGELTAQAVDAADRAETAAEQAAASGLVYESSAAGQADANLADGDYFFVVSADSDEVLELWRKGASSATDTGKRTVNSSVLSDSYSDLISGLSQSNFKPNLIDGDKSSTSETLPLVLGASTWSSGVDIIGNKRVFSFECLEDGSTVFSIRFDTDAEEYDDYLSFSFVFEKTDVAISALNSALVIRARDVNGEFIPSSSIELNLSTTGFNSSIIQNPKSIYFNGIDISGILAGASTISLGLQVRTFSDVVTGDKVLIHSPCVTADKISLFRPSYPNYLASEGEAW